MKSLMIAVACVLAVGCVGETEDIDQAESYITFSRDGWISAVSRAGGREIDARYVNDDIVEARYRFDEKFGSVFIVVDPKISNRAAWDQIGRQAEWSKDSLTNGKYRQRREWEAALSVNKFEVDQAKTRTDEVEQAQADLRAELAEGLSLIDDAVSSAVEDQLANQK